ncbi:MAG TPA: peptidase M28, partial [Thermoanaerobaculia bacterium]|nr:peptidase M28 [Thermoanaerobaculia bacterium]
PGFQFIQDPIEYDTRTHHTDYDVFERLQRDDLMQASVVMASFLWDAANRPEPLPRKYVRP